MEPGHPPRRALRDARVPGNARVPAQSVDVDREYVAVRLCQPCAWMAGTVPLDSQTWQRPVLRVHPELARRSRAPPLHDIEPPGRIKNYLHATILEFEDVRIAHPWILKFLDP